jgi:hypothetical protein
MADRIFVDLGGFRRAKVVNNKDEQKFGRVKIWIPDLMPLVSESVGIWARPANNQLGGRNKEDGCNYIGSSFIPAVGSWVWVFFECNNINRPYYFSSLNLDNSEVLPECRVGSEFQKKWVIFKSSDGRAIVISDDQDDARVEITGKKRQISNPPSGDEESVYSIDGNQTTILFDERPGKEKILIRTYKGDFLHIDIDERKLQAFFEEGISLKTSKTFCVECKDFNLKASGSIKETGASIDSKASGSHNIEGNPVNIKSGGALNTEAGGGSFNIKASGLVAIDGSGVSEMGGAAAGASGASEASECSVNGERDT